MTLEITVIIKNGKGELKNYLLTETQEAVKNDKTGKTTLAHFQPAAENRVIKTFSKLYIDTTELEKEPKAKEPKATK